MSMTRDQTESCSQETMGAEDSKKDSAESDLNQVNKIAGFDYLVRALKQCSEETKEEIVQTLDEMQMKESDGK